MSAEGRPDAAAGDAAAGDAAAGDAAVGDERPAGRRSARPRAAAGARGPLEIRAPGADALWVEPDLGDAIYGDAVSRATRRLPGATLLVLCAWALLAAGLCALLAVQLPGEPLVVAVVAVLLVAVGVLLGGAMAAERRAANRRLRAELRKASTMLRSIEAVTDPGLAFLDVDQLLATVLGRTKDALEVDVAAVLLADASDSVLRVRASSGATALAPVGSEVRLAEGVLGTASSWARPVVVADVGASGVGPLPDWQQGVTSLMAAPLIVLGAPVGTVEVASRTGRSFGAADRRLLQVVADHVAAVVERARLDDVVTRSRFGADHANLQLRLLARGGTALGKALYDYDDAMDELADVVVPDFADWFGVHILEDLGEVREVVARATPRAFPDRPRRHAGHPHHHGDELVQAAMMQRRAQVLMPTSRLGNEALGATVHTHETVGECPDVSSMLVVPVEVRGAFMASLSFATAPGRRGYRPSDLQTGRELAERVGVAIERVRSWQAAQRAGEVAARYAERLRRLVDVSLVLNARSSEEEVLELLTDHAGRALGAEVVVVRALADGDRPEVTEPAIDGAAIDGALAGVVGAATRAVAGARDVVRGLAHQGVASSPGTRPPAGQGTGDVARARGWIAAPITDASGVVCQAVVAVGTPGTAYSFEDESVLTVLAQMASVALRNARLYGEVLENEQRLQAVVDSSPLAIAELRVTGEAEWWNRAAAALFGWPDRAEPRRIPVRAGGELVLSGLLDSSFGGKPMIGVVVPVTGTGGEPLDLSISASPLGAPGAVTGVVVVAADVTGRERMLEQFHQAERLHAMSRMAGALAHDFNNLLTVILGCSEVLVRRLGDDMELGPDVAAIQRAGTRAAALTSQLVRIGGQRPAVQPELVRLDEVIEAMTPILAGALGEHVRLDVTLGAGSATVRVDPSELERCVLNLAINARDAMPDGGTCTVRTVLVPAGEEGAAGLAELCVADDGTGMDDETAAHCFEPFFTTKGRARGTGLGLAALHAIVSQAGGDVRVASALGEGTTFTISLPVVDTSPTVASDAGTLGAPAADAGTLGAPATHAGTLLVVDDEPEVLRLEVRALQSAGYEVLAAKDASEALHLLGAHDAVDLLVTDVVMPGMNGIELATAVRQRCPGVGVLFVSGHLDDAAARGSLPAHASLVTKPFGPDELAHAVRTLVRRAHVTA